MQKLLLINGPNLGTLGKRKPEIYGSTTLAEVVATVTGLAQQHQVEVVDFQSNHEGALIDFLEQHYDAMGAVVNPGALMMAGWSLRDALESFPAPWVEVHISDIYSRESFRHHSVLSELAAKVITGQGVKGYDLAVAYLLADNS